MKKLVMKQNSALSHLKIINRKIAMDNIKTEKKYSLWGKGIILFYIIFIAIMLCLVKIMTGDDMDLVKKDYYASGEEYQKNIEAQKRTLALAVKPFMSVEKNILTLTLSSHLQKQLKNPNIYIYSPSSAQEDLNLKPSFNNNGIFEYDTKNLRKGNWLVSFSWEDPSGKEYLLSERIYLK